MPGDFYQMIYEKANAEYEAFLLDLLELPKEEILKKSYEKVYKEELVSILKTGSFTEEEAKELSETEYLLDPLYQVWLKNNYSCVDYLDQTIRELLHNLA